MGKRRYIRQNRDDRSDKKQQRLKPAEEEAIAMHEYSVPSLSEELARKRVQVVQDVEEKDGDESLEDSVSESDAEEPTDMMKLMNEIGAAVESESSDEFDENSSESGDGEMGDSENDDSEMDDREIGENDLDDSYDGTDAEEAQTESGEEMSEEEYANGVEMENGKLNDASDDGVTDDESASEGESVEVYSNDSGSIDELSLDDSDPETQAEETTETRKAESSAKEMRESIDKMDPRTKKKKNKKLLDNAVDPTGNAEIKYDDLAQKTLRETIEEGDIFHKHFEQDVDAKLVAEIKDRTRWQSKRIQFDYLGPCVHITPPGAGDFVALEKDVPLQSVGVRNRLVNEIGKTLVSYDLTNSHEDKLIPFQQELFSVLNQYKDLMYTNEKFGDLSKLRHVYCLHALNHVLKSRLRVVLNSHEKWNTKIEHQTREYRDQGFTRPKVLILAPFKESALRIITMIISCLSTKKKSRVTGRKRFMEEFFPDAEAPGIHHAKPDDYIKTFAGNTDDCFRVGLQLKKAGLSIFASFYESDILICSPLGLRLIIGADGDYERDYDFMSSIELLIIDQADVMYMQNWDHLLHCIKMLHVQPKDRRDTDFNRLRTWIADGHSKLYRQTLVFSGINIPEISSIFSKHCSNIAGEIRQLPAETEGSIKQIIIPVPVTFHKYASTNAVNMADDRFHYFINQILPKYTERRKVLIYIPSYFDFVRVRNHLTKAGIRLSIYSEYSTESGRRRARRELASSKTQFMLYSERIHFFDRCLKSSKARHIIFYSLPTFPQFFSELINSNGSAMQSSKEISCLVLFNKMDALKLANAVGTRRAQRLISSDKNVFIFGTGEIG